MGATPVITNAPSSTRTVARFPAWTAHARRMAERPAVRTVFEREGLALPASGWMPLDAVASVDAVRWTVQPYLGIGYSLSTRSGWGFAADLGLGGRRSGDGLRLAPTGRGGSVDRVLDELRLAPVLQLGVSYAF